MTQSDVIDWLAVEREYRLGQLFLSEIAATYGLTDHALRKRAAAEGWVRGDAREEERQLAARRGLEVAREHRRLLGDLRETLGLVQQSLRDHLSAAGPPGEGPFSAGAETVAGLVRALGGTAERLIRLERQAFGLDQQGVTAGDDETDAADIRERLSERLARLAVGGDAGGLSEGPEPA